MAIAYLGIGSNIGDRVRNLWEAVKRLKNVEGLEVVSHSEFYFTKAQGGPPQDSYVNGVLAIKTKDTPQKLLTILKKIELEMGREPIKERNLPRIIDIDILLYDKLVMETTALTLPHPRLSERYFALRGLCEIAPDVMHPVLGKTVRELYGYVRSGDTPASQGGDTPAVVV